MHRHTYREEKSYTFKADFLSFVIQARTAAGGEMLLHLLSRLPHACSWLAHRERGRQDLIVCARGDY